MAIDLEGIAALKALQDARIRAENGGVMPAADPNAAKIEAQLAEINANMSKPKKEVSLSEMLADAKAVQDANTVRDPAIVAQEADIAASIARIDANRKIQPESQPRVDTEGIAAAAEAQRANSLQSTPAESALTPKSEFVGPGEQLTDAGIPAGREMGVAFDDEGNLKPGWTKDPSGQYMTATDPNFVDQATVSSASESRAEFARSQALDANGNLKEGYTYDEFGTPVTKASVAAANQQTVGSKADAGASDHGTPYDDEGNLNNGWALNENGDAVWQGAGYNDKTGVTAKPIKDDPGVTDHGPAYDDDGNLMPGFALDDNNNAKWVGKGFVEPATAAQAEKDRKAAAAKGISAPQKEAIKKVLFKQKEDWRVRLSLAPNATYLYRAAKDSNHILFPLVETDGVIFPYTPSVSVTYQANYDGTDLTHSNYKHYQYKNSEVSAVTITATFTAQSTADANYLLAVIHFFRSATKMFYGQDSNPKNGTPPPLCYLSGYGAYQFDNHPLVLTSFAMTLPDDVDYVRAGTNMSLGTYSSDAPQKAKQKSTGWLDSIKSRLSSSKLNKGGIKDEPVFSSLGNKEATYVPSKVQFVITCLPMVTRNDVSNNFSLEKYASGELLRGSKRKTGGGGIW